MLDRLRNNSLIENIFSLSILNGLNLILPLVTIPYLVATVGSAHYGIYSIVYSIVQYALLVSNYGFSYTSTKQIAQNRDNIETVSCIFSSTILAKIILSAISIVVCAGIVQLFFPKYMLVYLLGLGIILGDVINPVWLFQGMENMKYLTISNGVAKIIFTLLIFVFVRNSDDYVYIIFLNSIGFLTGGIVSIVIARFVFHIKFTLVGLKDAWKQIREGQVVFFSTVFTNLFNNSFVVILGLFVSEYSVGIYAAVDKIIKAAKILVDPISNALFPHVSRIFKENGNMENVSRLFHYGKVIGCLLLSIVVVLDLTAPFVCNIFLKSIADESIMMIRLLSPVIVLGGLNYVFGVVGLINLGSQKAWLKNLFISSLAGISFLLLTVKSIDIMAAVVGTIVAELSLFIMTIIELIKLKKEDCICRQ